MTGTERPSDRDRQLRIVIFSGGRGSTVLSKELLRDSRISLTLAINGYDDGLSTGEIRRFLGEALGPSDFRKNAHSLAGELNTCPKELLEVLDTRIAEGTDRTQGGAILKGLGRHLDRKTAESLIAVIQPFEEELAATGRPFEFGDCSIGNIAFAGCFLAEARDFNRAVDRVFGTGRPARRPDRERHRPAPTLFW